MLKLTGVKTKNNLINFIMNRKTNEQRPVFPFTSIVGQEEIYELYKSIREYAYRKVIIYTK